jgi:hypothetical protein
MGAKQRLGSLFVGISSFVRANRRTKERYVLVRRVRFAWPKRGAGERQ